MIENFFGFVEGIGGAELARLAGRQAERFGAELVLLRGVVGSTRGLDGTRTLVIDGGYEVTADAVLASTGMVWRRLEVDGVSELLHRGVYYGAGRSEAARCGGEEVVMVAGNSAGQAALHLANAGARVTMAVRGDELGARMSAYLVGRIEGHPLIDVRRSTQVTEVHAEGGRLGAVTIAESGGRRQQLRAHALFVCIGGVPQTAWAPSLGVRLNEASYILTGTDLLADGRRPDGWWPDRDPLMLETSIPGLFAAGDVRSGSTKRVAAAVGEGAMAVALVQRWLEEVAARAEP